MIKVVFCDLGGVLVLNNINEVTKSYEQKYGLTRDMIRQVFAFVQSGQKSDEELNGYLEEQKIDPDVWRQFMKEFFNTEVRNQRLLEILEKAKESGIMIFLTTNNAPGVTEVVRKYGVFEIADEIVSSADIGVSKPDIKYWELAFKKATEIVNGIIREEVLVIDDSRANCKSAQEFGLQTVIYKNDEVTNREISVRLS